MSPEDNNSFFQVQWPQSWTNWPGLIFWSALNISKTPSNLTVTLITLNLTNTFWGQSGVANRSSPKEKSKYLRLAANISLWLMSVWEIHRVLVISTFPIPSIKYFRYFKQAKSITYTEFCSVQPYNIKQDIPL